jgi:hypothetical protein
MGVLLGCALQAGSQSTYMCPTAAKPTSGLNSLPTLKLPQSQRGETLSISVEAATAPDPICARLTRDGKSIDIEAQFNPPPANEKNGTVAGVLPDNLALGKWAVELIWGSNHYRPGTVDIQPIGAQCPQLTKLEPASTYEKASAVTLVLRGSGFQVAKPSENALWIDGVRRTDASWVDSCTTTPESDGKIHGCVASSEEIHLSSIPVPENGVVPLMVGYGDTPSKPLVFRVFSMGRIRVASWSAGIALVLALLPLLLLASMQRAYRIADSNYKFRMLFLDPETDTYSLSKLQFYLWTVAAIFGYTYLFISKVVVQLAPWPDVPASLPGIILVAGGTAVTSQIITSTKGSKGAGDEKPSFADFITSGSVVAPDRLQMLLWTLFGVGAFFYAVMQLFPGTIADLPAIPDRLMVLMGISSAGYLGGKMARKAGPVIAEIAITPAESDTGLAARQDQDETPDLVGAITRAQQALAKMKPLTNANAKAARDALDQAARSAGAAHTGADFSKLVTDLEMRCTTAESAAAAAAADFTAGKTGADEAEAAQSAAAALQDFTGDVLQAISLASGGPMQAEVNPPLIARTINLRGNNLSDQALFEIDQIDLPFRMLTDPDGKNQPQIVTRDQANPTCASVLRLSIDPLKLGETDLAQFTAWFAKDGPHKMTIINPDGQKSELSFNIPPAVGQKVNA